MTISPDLMKIIRTCRQDIPPTGGKIGCNPCTEHNLAAEMQFDSTAEKGTVTVRLDVYARDALPSPPGKTVGSEMLKISPKDLQVNDDIQVNLTYSRLKDPVIYGKGKREWKELPKQITLSRTVLGARWKNKGGLDYTVFCVAERK